MEASATEKSSALPPLRGPRHPSETEFSSGILWSVIAHIAVLLAILIKSLVFPSKAVVYIPSLRVDIVGLPDVLKKDRAKLGAAPLSPEIAEALKKAEKQARELKPPVLKKSADKTTEKAEADEMVLKPKGDAKAREKKLKGALARIKALAKISSETEANPGLKGTTLIKGNQISKGTSLSGEARESAAASYFDLLRSHLQDSWALPVWIARQNYSAQVQVFITERGRLQSYRFVKLSGNPQFDDAVKKTLMESQPYPLPPSEIKGTLANGILIGFPL